MPQLSVPEPPESLGPAPLLDLPFEPLLDPVPPPPLLLPPPLDDGTPLLLAPGPQPATHTSAIAVKVAPSPLCDMFVVPFTGSARGG